MSASMDINALSKLIIKHLSELLSPIQLIIIFGSFANQEQTKDSDIDIAFLSPTTLNNVQRWEIAQSLAQKINRDVDLVNLKEASQVLKFQVVSKGNIIYQAENMDQYLDNVYSMYLKFNEDRQEILKHYGK